MSEQNWRTEVTAEDHFIHTKKAAQLADRRPVFRTSTDLVGPGIGAAAVRITNFNAPIATFNGYFSSLAGAIAAPNATEAFIGYVISDAVLGGQQVFTGLTSGVVYTRSFTRSPTDPEALGWTNWGGARIPATVEASTVNPTTVGSSGLEPLNGPSGVSIGETGVFEIADYGLRIRKQGVYTGVIEVGCATAGITGEVVVQRPAGSTPRAVTYLGVNLSTTFVLPFTVWTTNDEAGITVAARPSAGTTDLWWRYQCTRTGDAV